MGKITVIKENLNINKNYKWIIILLLIFLTIIRVSLATNMPFCGLGNAMHDDKLLADMSNSLQNAEWLGAYNNRTLVKGVSYPIFLMVCYWLGIPSSLGLILLFILSIIVFVIAISKIISGFFSKSIIYLFLLYMPSMFNTTYTQRVYSLGFVIPMSIFVFSFIIGLFLRRYEKNITLIKWSMGAGIFLSLFYYTREDSLWIMPFVICALLIMFILYIFLVKEIKAKEFIKKVLILLIPIICLATFSSSISLINYKCYGVYVINDRTDTYFAKLMQNMLKVDAGEKPDNVWITREMVNEVLEVSPTLASIEGSIDNIYTSGWVTGKEINLDIFFWAIRDAVSAEGYYVDAKTANEFYKQANEEVEAAFEDGRLKQEKDKIYISKLGNGLDEKQIKEVFKKTFVGLYDTISNSQYENNIIIGTGSFEQLRYLEVVSGDSIVFPSTDGVDDSIIFKSSFVNEISKLIIIAYKKIGFIIGSLSILFYIIIFFNSIIDLRSKKYELLSVWVILSGMLASIFILTFGVSWLVYTIDIWEEYISRYTPATGAIFMMFECLSIYTGILIFLKKMKIGKRRNS